jgi:Caspase domain/Bacterial Ig domain
MTRMAVLITMLLVMAGMPSLSAGARPRAASSQGIVLRVDRFSAEPPTLSPGQQLTLSGEYSVMASDRHARLLVIESVITSFYDEQTQQWKAVLRNHTSRTVSPGKHRFSPPGLTPPLQPPGGKFLLTFQVTHADVSDQQSREVLIGLRPAPAPDQGPPPVIALASPAQGQQVTSEQIQVSGKATSVQGIVRVDVQVNGELQAQSTPHGSTTVDFSEPVALRPGTNEIVVTAFDQGNHSARQRVAVTRVEDRPLPPAPVGVPVAGSEKRVALVIGNSQYKEAPLRNPTNDARGMAAILRELGFEVTLGEDLSKREMGEAIRAFGQQLRGGNVGLFYFAGHGVQVNGINYLIPIGAQIEKELDVEFEAVHVDRVLAEMEAAENKMNIVILDACRGNPLARSSRSGTRGLAPVLAPSGTLIAYATAPGSVAADGDGRNGLYTEVLLQQIRLPDLKIEDVFKGVRRAVKAKSRGRQVPWETSALEGDFYFAR